VSKPFVTIEGFPELMEKIKLIGDDKTKRQEVLKVLRQVANATVVVARVNAPMSKKPHLVSGKRTRQVIQPGSLKKSIGTITGKSENPTILVGPRAKGSNIGFYGNWVEKGHNIYAKGFKRKRTGTSKAKLFNNAAAKKRTKADLFMSRTYDQTKGQVTNEAEKKFAAYIQKQIDRLSR
jgi:hypothetical protein